jgi:hypothetical protein
VWLGEEDLDVDMAYDTLKRATYVGLVKSLPGNSFRRNCIFL